VKRRAARATLAPEAALLMREAFEPRYGRKLDDGELDAMADRIRRFTAIVTGWEAEDRARAAASAPGEAAPPSTPHGVAR
jgi:hypothetical protein